MMPEIIIYSKYQRVLAKALAHFQQHSLALAPSFTLLSCDQIKLYGESMILVRLEDTFDKPLMNLLASLVRLDHDQKVIEMTDGC